MTKIAESTLIRGPRPYAGEINIGDVFAWEPDLPHAAALMVVTGVSADRVWARYIDSDHAYCNTVERFREACFATRYRPHSVKRLTFPIAPDFVWQRDSDDGLCGGCGKCADCLAEEYSDAKPAENEPKAYLWTLGSRSCLFYSDRRAAQYQQEHGGKITPLAPISTATTSQIEQFEVVTWWNGCDRTVPEALRHVANKGVSVGPVRFSGEHLIQLAQEIEEMAKTQLYKPAQSS